MVDSLDKLSPYVSLLLLEKRVRSARLARLERLLDELVVVLRLDQEPRTTVDRVGPIRSGRLTIGFLHYEERRQPRWTSDSSTLDVLNQLALVAVRGAYVAVLLTDPARVPAIVRTLDSETPGSLSSLRMISPGTLNAAFAEGPARTLWLSGIHTRTSVKADSKILTGADLRDALDPLGDQTYYFTAVRAVNNVGPRQITVGLSPGKARVWTGVSRDWREFTDTLNGIFTVLDRTEQARRTDLTPIPILASRATTGLDARNAFDLSVVAPETLADETGDPDVLEAVEQWAYNGRFSVVASNGADLTANVSLSGEELGTIDLKVDLSNMDRVSCEVTPHPYLGSEDLMKEAAGICGNRHYVQVRYESGHVLSDGMLYSPRFRDVRFGGWRWIDLTGIDVCKEKPVKIGSDKPVFDPEAVGLQNSLFCWAWNHWPDLTGQGERRGWMACDDGSMEIADFIHFDDTLDIPLLTVVHVKGAHSSALDRGISVSDYEVVTSQAVKNLRYLDRMLLADGLEKGLKKVVGSIVWHSGVKQDNRRGMLAALRGAGENYSRRVVVLQPRVLKSEFDGARAELDARRETGRTARLRQLETLLAGADQNCRAAGADLLVLGDGTPGAREAQGAPPRRPRAGSRARRGS
jgi:hypothetical protein